MVNFFVSYYRSKSDMRPGLKKPPRMNSGKGWLKIWVLEPQEREARPKGIWTLEKSPFLYPKAYVGHTNKNFLRQDTSFAHTWTSGTMLFMGLRSHTYSSRSSNTDWHMNPKLAMHTKKKTVVKTTRSHEVFKSKLVLSRVKAESS